MARATARLPFSSHWARSTSGRSAIVDRVAVVVAESFTSEEITTLEAAARLIERLAELL
jgi:hypothetical protein